MALGILGKKIGMTQVYSEDGRIANITAVSAGPCPILAIRDKSLQLGFDPLAEKRAKKPLLGYFKKLQTPPLKFIREVVKDSSKEYKIGEEIKVDLFQPGDLVDVTGISKGKGFQGGMKRWNWAGGPKSHGSTSHRRVGSIGSTTTPGRVFKGHHLPGHMGSCRVTVQNLEVIKVLPENNLLLIKGAIPGAKNSYLLIRKAKKKKKIETITPKTQAVKAAKKPELQKAK